MTNHSGAFVDYGLSKKQVKRFYGANDYKTSKGILASGHVLKKDTLLESDANGKLIPHSGMVEKALVTFADILGSKTVILGGLTFSSTTAVAKAVLVNAFKNLTAGMTAAQANALNPVTGGSFTSGTLGNWNVLKSSTADSVVFYSTTPNTNVTDLADSGNGSGTTISITGINSPLKKIAGALAFDVDASGGDITLDYITEATYWDTAPVWYNNPDSDTITLEDGTTKAVTDYYTGASTYYLKKKITEGSEIEIYGGLTAGETY